jgi:lysophospholipase L1-like esterase
MTNWVFLGDSLTEGVGSKRISHVAELAKQLRTSGVAANVHEFRLRHIDALNGQVEFNIAGLMNVAQQQESADLWLWNLACEGQTIDSDLEWLPLIGALRPELVVIFRGSLESIIRPAMVSDAQWPWWVPRSWRNYSAMDPRCYFSITWWRKAKQTSVDALKQSVRLKLLQARPGKPLIDLDTFASYQTELIKQLRHFGTRVLVLGLLPVDAERFPSSAEHFKSVNARLKQVADAESVEFFDWAAQLNGDALFYRDGFHPNEAGAIALAKILGERLGFASNKA